MAKRRMFAKAIVESAKFLKMPASSQNLYFHLGIHADDDGIVEAYSVMNLIKANEDDLKVLLSKGYVVILNEDLVAYITDWKKHNQIRADRKNDSIYQDLLLQVVPDVVLHQKKERSNLVNKSGPSMDGELSAQCSLVESSIGEKSTDKDSAVHTAPEAVKYQLDQDCLTENEYSLLVNKYSQYVVDDVIARILEKPYHGCLKMDVIDKWCAEKNGKFAVAAEYKTESVHAEQLLRLAAERLGD